MAVSKRVRFEVFKRDLFTCQYCGKRPPEVMLECDHIHPRCDGGSDEMDNLATSCSTCNQGKSGKGLGKVAPAVDELTRLAAMQEMSERSELLLQEQVAMNKQEEAVKDVVALVFFWWYQEIGCTEEFFAAFQDKSIKTFFRRGLGLTDFRDAIDSTATKMRLKDLYPGAAWRYFCGACWGIIRQREAGE